MRIRQDAKLTRIAFAWLLATGVLVQPVLGAEPDAPEPDAQGLAFFESKIRPLLIERCGECHGPDLQEASLRLDRLSAALQGGDSGPALVPGNVEGSLIVQAIRYDGALQMPPDGKLPDEQIALLRDWIERGAAGPRDDGPTDSPATSKAKSTTEVFDLAARLDHWCYQPLAAAPPSTVRDTGWPKSPVDAFILAGLESADLPPAAPADRATWLRRVTFDLVGFPPTPEETAAFLADSSPDAADRVIERLLASPHYGERWARHWLDVVRFAETLGHEFDFELANSWRYRDYVVRALNQDLPYDQLVLEHLAGDLLPRPRRDPVTGLNESVVATGFFWLGEAKHSPVDVRQEETERVDNQIDVLGKAFLAQTIGCARCHDHKFDAISARDYYALFGYVKSSRYQQATLDDFRAPAHPAARLARQRAEVRAVWQTAVADRDFSAPQLGQLLREGSRRAWPDAPGLARTNPSGPADATLASRWAELLRDPAVDAPEHPLFLWKRLATAPAEVSWAQLRDTLAAEFSVPTSDGSAPDAGPAFATWQRTGAAWVDDITATPGAARWLFGRNPSRPIERMLSPWSAHSGLVSRRLEGELRSPSFTIGPGRYLHVLAAGEGTRVNLVIDGLNILRDPVYGGLTRELKSPNQPQWLTFDLAMWRGHRAYLELCDSTTPNLADSPRSVAQPTEAWFDLRCMVGNDVPSPPRLPGAVTAELLADSAIDSIESLAANLEQRLVHAADALRQPSWPINGDAQGDAASPTRSTLATFELANVLLDVGEFDLRETERAKLASLLAACQETETRVTLPTRAPALTDDIGQDEHLLVRGSYRRPGPVVARRAPGFLSHGAALAQWHPTQSHPAQGRPHFASFRVPDDRAAESAAANDAAAYDPAAGSGRLQLAEQLVTTGQHMVARAIVNRLWQHHFGRGIVATPDDFGRMGQPPTHPELLDWLAAELIRQKWSLKAIHRVMLRSSVYAQSSVADESALTVDPTNQKFGRMNVVRLEAEAIRDTMFALAGSLNARVGGPGVTPFLTPFMEMTGRPASGPLDSQGRRSLYITVRRNFLTPLLVVYDYPVPFSSMGRRNVSNVPAQALSLLNDPLVLEQAQRWAQHVSTGAGDTAQNDTAEKVTAMFQHAFTRAPDAQELATSLDFLASRDPAHATDAAAPPPSPEPTPAAWADLAHLLLNMKELIYVP